MYNLLPELLLVLALIALPLIKGSSNSKLKFVVASAALAAAFIFVLAEIYSPPKSLFEGLFVLDPYSSYVKLTLLFLPLFIIACFRKVWDESKHQLILLITLGALTSVSSSNLIMTFAGLEVISLGCFMLFREQSKTALKYFIYSAVSSGVMLYGITLLYGLSGSMGYSGISAALSTGGANKMTIAIALVMMLCGVGFKMALFPFNFIFPSIAEKLPLRKFSLLIILIIAAVAAAGRLLLTIFHDPNAFIIDAASYRMQDIVKWQNIIYIVSAVSVIAGNLVIFRQSDIKKIFSYILIAQAGYLILPLASASPAGTAEFISVLFTFTLNSSCMIIFLKMLTSDPENENISIDKLIGFGKANSLAGISFILLLISFAGMPLTAAFHSRLYSIDSFFNSSMALLSVPVILSIVAFLIFIIRFSLKIFSIPKSEKPFILEPIHKIILLSLLFFIYLFGIYHSPIDNLSKYCSILLGI